MPQRIERRNTASVRRAGMGRPRTLRRPAVEILEGRALLSADFTRAIGIGSNTMAAKAVATDAAGDLFVAGTFAGTVTFGSGAGATTLTSNGPDRDIFVAKYNAAGNLVFARRAGSNGSDEAHGVAVDGQGNVYVTGTFTGSVNFDPNGNHTLNAPGQNNLFVWKLSPSGNYAYAQAPQGTAGSLNIGEAIAVDSAGNAYITGSFQQTLTFGATSVTAAGNTDAFVARLGPSGAFAWARSFVGSAGAINEGDGIAVDGNGNVYTVGQFGKTVDFDPGAGSFPLTSTGGQNEDGFVSKLDSSGNFVYARQIGGNSYDAALAVAVDAQRNVYVTGFFSGSANFGAITLNKPGNQVGVFAAKLDSSGSFAFARDLGVTAQVLSNSKQVGIGLDAGGNIYVAGPYQGTTTVGPTTLGGFGDLDGFVARLNPAGSIVASARLGSPGLDLVNGVAVNGNGLVSVAGAYAGSPGTFGNFNLPSQGAANMFAAQLTLTPGSVKSKAPDDFDGDGKTDLSVFRPSQALWLVLQSTAGAIGRVLGAQGTDIPVAADFDGDGKTDYAIYRPSTAEWFILHSDGSPGQHLVFGQANVDIPVVADYDGDGKADIAVYRPTTSQWFVLYSGGGVLPGVVWGAPNIDMPVPADFDGDGKADIAVYRPSTAHWYIAPSGGGAARDIYIGAVNKDKPIPADYDGDGKADIAVYRTTTGEWFILHSDGTPGQHLVLGKVNDDQPLTGDFDGDGKIDIAVYRPSVARWLIIHSDGTPGQDVNFGGPGVDVPLPSALVYSYRGTLGTRGVAIRSLGPVVAAPEVPPQPAPSPAGSTTRAARAQALTVRGLANQPDDKIDPVTALALDELDSFGTGLKGPA